VSIPANPKMNAAEQNRRDGTALRRIARELREILPSDIDPTVLEDIETVDRVGRWLQCSRPITLAFDPKDSTTYVVPVGADGIATVIFGVDGTARLDPAQVS
jgi:hypothetical protein